MKLEGLDNDRLLAMLRETERRGDGQRCIAVCARLVETGKWRVVWELGKLWANEAWLRGDPELARLAANVLRLLAPVAGQPWEGAGCAECGGELIQVTTTNPIVTDVFPHGSWQCAVSMGNHDPGIAPNPLRRYVEALRVWRPDGWREWLALQTGCSTVKHTDTGKLSLLLSSRHQAYVGYDGGVSCGVSCPWLPVVPIEGA